MAAPALYGVGSFDSGNGAVSPTVPSGLPANSIVLLLCFVQSSNQTISAPTNSGGTGWSTLTWLQLGDQTEVAAGTAATAGAYRLGVYYLKINTAICTPGTVSVADTGNHTIAQIAAFTGIVETGSPWTNLNQTIGGSGYGIYWNFASNTAVSTTVNDALVLGIGCASHDTADQSNCTTPAAGLLANVSFVCQAWTQTGTGGGFVVIQGTKATAGQVVDGGTAGTNDIGCSSVVNGNYGMRIIQLIPPISTYDVDFTEAGTSATNINSGAYKKTDANTTGTSATNVAGAQIEARAVTLNNTSTAQADGVDAGAPVIEERDGSATGTCATTINASAVWGGQGSSTGASTTQADSSAIWRASANTTGTSTAAAYSASFVAVDANASGSSTTTVNTNAIWRTNVSATGQATLSINSGATWGNTVSTSGIGTATGEGRAVWDGQASAIGTSTPSVNVSAFQLVTVTTSGLATIVGNENAIWNISASASGSSSVSGDIADAAGTGSDAIATGTSTVGADSGSVKGVGASSAGTCVTTVNVAWWFSSNASTAGTCTVSADAFARVRMSVDASATGLGTASGVLCALWCVSGSSSGVVTLTFNSVQFTGIVGAASGTSVVLGEGFDAASGETWVFYAGQVAGSDLAGTSAKSNTTSYVAESNVSAPSTVSKPSGTTTDSDLIGLTTESDLKVYLAELQ